VSLDLEALEITRQVFEAHGNLALVCGESEAAEMVRMARETIVLIRGKAPRLPLTEVALDLFRETGEVAGLAYLAALVQLVNEEKLNAQGNAA
jgi:hypothetical protein